MLSSPFVGLLVMAVPGLGPFAALLNISVAVISGIKLAMNTMSVAEAIRREAPELHPIIERLAIQAGVSTDHVAHAWLAPGQLTTAERDFWTDHLNKARNL